MWVPPFYVCVGIFFFSCNIRSLNPFGLLFVADKDYVCIHNTGEKIHDIFTHKLRLTQNEAQSNVVEINNSRKDDNNNSHHTTVF